MPGSVAKVIAFVFREPGRHGGSTFDRTVDYHTPMTTYRIGLLVPSSNTTIESELPALLGHRARSHPDEQFTFHSSRMRMRQVTPEELKRMNVETRRAGAELADAHVDVAATACLVAIMSEGPGAHRRVEDLIAAVLAEEGAPAPVVSSAGALVEAVKALGAKRVAMITPYKKSLTAAVADYLGASDIEVCDALSLEVADNQAVAALDPYALREHWRTLDLCGAEALILSACVQMRSLEVIEEIEQTAGLPTLSAATATAWSILGKLGLEQKAPIGGALLSSTTGLVARA
jgi:maleate isomerase